MTVTPRRLSVEEPILLSNVSNGSEVELSDSLEPADFHLATGHSPRHASRHPGVATIHEGEERGSVRSGSASGSPRGSMAAHAKPLSLLPLVALIFFDVSGGPFGIEDAVSRGAPLLAVLGFIILPIIWSVPEALVTAELATTFPENSGYVAWVTAAFGPFWGFQKGFYAWVSGVIDNAVYPVLFLEYLQAVWPVLESFWPRLIFLVGLNFALSYLNYRGLHVVGEAAIGMTIFTLLPFLAMVLLGLPHVQPSNWVKVDWDTVEWLPFLNVMFWCLNYWDSVSTLAGEVQNPTKTFPRALFGAVILVVCSYLLPLLVGLGVTSDPSAWQSGYLAVIGEKVGGSWLAWWIVASAAVSQIGQFEAEMCSDSYQLLGMSERGFLPSIFHHRSKYGTPTFGILASSLGVMGLATFNFQTIVDLVNCAYCLGQLLEFVAFIWLRIKYPALIRPFRVPLPTWACALALVPACILLLGLIVVPWVVGDLSVIIFTIVVVVVGAVLHPLLQAARHRGWLGFHDTTPTAFKEMLFAMYSPVDEDASDMRSSGSQEWQGLVGGGGGGAALPSYSAPRG
ncbi:putative polyamine transporter isoform A [Micractinium conductrix]|uniref:Putative polyamine transporter isoform A n=1 Tax=Micractinium conductrix TaxID=554055 RepID=A0A2P6UZE6_9CHLO|nr:putative polyamine transporter isoform B [Micractinium conductrix]PSC67222.1 putative polyamine transporter isoform A [Micractinium conductrix]|eukprot:PSC67221.1 putative polyamine transporter isoform B [Micractinium conductrix]